MDNLKNTRFPKFLNRIGEINKNNNGLFYGNAGEVILLYLLSKKFKDPLLSERAAILLNSIADNIADVESLNFDNGLAGIGWAIECIAQNNFLEMNTNEILEEIDDVLYKSVLYNSDDNISLANGLLGKFNYFLSRFKSRNQNTHRLKNIFHEECLILLTDDLNEKLLGEFGVVNKKELNKNDLLNLGHSIYFLSAFLPLRVNLFVVESTLYETVKFVDEYLNKLKNNTVEIKQKEYILFLSNCYWFTGENHQHNYWKECALKFIRFFKSPNKVINNEVTSLEKILSLISQVSVSSFEENDLFKSNSENDPEHITLVSTPGKLLVKDCSGIISPQIERDLLIMV
ncbi:MAG: lanthionine synthetase LanC family protein [Ferruginibacter sp.]